MKDYESEVENLIKSDACVIEMPSFEWERVHEIIGNVALDLDADTFTWSAVSGIKGWSKKKRSYCEDVDPTSVTISAALDWLGRQTTNSIMILEDCHPYLDATQPANIRWLREMMRRDDYINHNLVKAVVLSCPSQVVPEELSKELPVIELELPDRDIIENVARQTVTKYQDYCLKSDITQKVLESALGLTVMEARLAFSKAILQDRQLTEDEIPTIIEEKEQIIKKSGLLEYYHPEHDLSSVGGLENLKEWIRRRGTAYSDRAKRFGLNTPRGVLLLGVPGCGKSLTAKAIANEWKMPLLRFDFGRVFGGLVGESERNIRYALNVAETISPCVLWVDEIEKGLSGSQSSGRSDGGTSSRVMGTFLTWLQEKTKPVFVVATANDVSQLPPELLRKGRLDEIFFVDLPSEKERESIFNIQLAKKDRNAKKLNINVKELASMTQNFSGAEIEEAVNEAVIDVYADNVLSEETTEIPKHESFDITQDSLKKVIKQITPLAQIKADEIEGVREWALKNRARRASTEEQEEVMPVEEAEEHFSRYSGLMRQKKNSDDTKKSVA